MESSATPILCDETDGSGVPPLVAGDRWVIHPKPSLRERVANAWPVVEREMREESRRPSNYWLRLLAAGVLVAVFGGVMFTTNTDPSGVGRELFGRLAFVLTLALLIIVPAMTSDCISRERREGTLGLLFLTPLTAIDVVAGKSIVHVLRSVTLLMASLPVLVLPFMMGGIDWRDGAFAFGHVVSVLTIGIAAGVFASARGGTAVQSIVMAECFALCLAVILSLWTFLWILIWTQFFRQRSVRIRVRRGDGGWRRVHF